MLTTLPLIDTALCEQVSFHLRLGAGSIVVFAKRTAIPVQCFTAECTFAYSGRLNLIETYILKAAAEFSPTTAELVDLTSLDEGLVRLVIRDLTRLGLLNGDDILTLTDKGRKRYHRILTETHIKAQVSVYLCSLTNKVHLLDPKARYVAVGGQDEELLGTNHLCQAKHSLSKDALLKALGSTTIENPWAEYRLLSIESVNADESLKGVPVGLFLIHDVLKDSLELRVIDLFRKERAPEYERLYDPEHVVKNAVSAAAHDTR